METFIEYKNRDLKDIYFEFLTKYNEDDVLINHRTYIEENKLGFGEKPFHSLWNEIVKTQKKEFNFLEIGVYKGQILSLVKLLSDRYNKELQYVGVTPLNNTGDKFSSYDKENNKWYTYPVGSNKKEWTEVKSGQMKSALNAMFTSNKLPNKADAINLDDTIKKSKVTEINLNTLQLESKNKEIKADIPKFNINDPNEIYKPYGEEGPDVYYSKENDQYIVKDGEKRNIIEK